MNSSDKQPITINIVQGAHGAEFDSSDLQIGAGIGTIWVNQTESPQVILPDNQETRRVMTLAPKGQEGAVWMMQMRSSQGPLSYCAADASKISRTRSVSFCCDIGLFLLHPPCKSRPTPTPASVPTVTIARNSRPARTGP